MKNKTKKLIFIFLINFFFTTNAISQEVNFEANSIELIDKDQKIIAKKNIKIFNKKETIYADEMDYDKLKQIINAKGNIRVENLEENIDIFSDELIYFRNDEKIILKKNVKINLEKKLLLETEKIIYDKIKKQIIIDNFSTFKDYYGNKISSEKSQFLLSQKLLKIDTVNMTDNISNKYFFQNAIVDFKNNEIIGDDVKVDFFKSSFGNMENDPRLRGNYLYSDNNISVIKKGVFTTCKKNKDECPPWQFKAQEIKHNKTKNYLL